jgi:hypothetical protein
MNEQDYLLAWGAYAIAALGCLLVWWRLTGWLWRYLREPLRLVMAVLLATPTIVDAGREQFAPAVAIVALDSLFKVGNSQLRALADLLMYGAIAAVLYLIFVCLRALVMRGRGAQAQTEPDEDPRTLRERMHDDLEPALSRQGAVGSRREPRL